jgi:hypothetical protein
MFFIIGSTTLVLTKLVYLVCKMGMFPYICEKCGGGDECCGSESCENGEECGGGQFCWSERAICLIDEIKLVPHMMTEKQMEMAQKIYDEWKGKPLKMTYDGYGVFSCIKFPGVDFSVNCNGGDDFEYGIHVKAWCEKCWNDAD